LPHGNILLIQVSVGDYKVGSDVPLTVLFKTDANAGVSGDGSTIDFTEDDIKRAISACKYFMDDDSALREHLLEQKMEAEDSIKSFAEIFQQIAPNIKQLTTSEDTSIEGARENIADIWKFHEDILSAYDDVKTTDDSAQIQIYFG
jgi:hypothetical protein